MKPHIKIRKRNTSSRSKSFTPIICNQSNTELLEQVPSTIINKYKKNVSSSINKLISNHKNKITNAINISKELNLSTACKHLNLYSTTNSQQQQTSQQQQPKQQQSQYQSLLPVMNDADKQSAAQFRIPPFIEIFRHLFTLAGFTKHFTQGELDEANKILALPTKHEIYKKLHHSELGIKLADTFAKYGHSIDLISKFPTTDFHSLLFNSFTSYQILELIETQMNHVTICTLTAASKQYPNFLYIFHNGQGQESKSSSNELLDYFGVNAIAEHILKRIVFLNKLIGKDNLPNRLIIFLTDAKKEVDDALEHAAHFRTLNINTAVTNMRDIIIYRREELFKSIFHEFIHFHNLDFKTLPTDIEKMMLDNLAATHNISLTNEYLLYEAVTESLANTLNAIFLSSSISQFKQNLLLEILFSTFQVSKILGVCHYASWEEFAMLDGHVKTPGKQWRQDSCVFSYYVLKLYILLNLDTYWTNMLDSNLRVQTSMSHFKHLLDIFEQGRHNLALRHVVNHLLKNLSSTSKNKNKNKKTKINTTLRMTCLDASL